MLGHAHATCRPSHSARAEHDNRIQVCTSCVRGAMKSGALHTGTPPCLRLSINFVHTRLLEQVRRAAAGDHWTP